MLRYNEIYVATKGIVFEVKFLEIVEARHEHFMDVYKLICELENTLVDKRSLLKVYTHNLTSKDIHYILAVEDSRVVGFASLHIQQLLHHAAKIGELQEIIVCKEKQGVGIGRILFEAIKEIAVNNQCIQLEICCNQARKASHEFYLKQGAKNSHNKFTLPIS